MRHQIKTSAAKLSITALLLIALVSCHKTAPIGPVAPTSTTVTVNYVADNTDFTNPERGFYRFTETVAGSFVPLNLNQLKGYRTEQNISTATYKVLSTLVYRNYVLEGFNNAPLSAPVLNNIKGDFDVARQAGVKLIPRFTYTVTTHSGACPEKSICAPYGDAPKAVVLNHIAQLKQMFIDNADVIACVQFGFIGIWGENYYTDYFGDASPNAAQGKLLDGNWQDRIEVLQALLNAVPKDRMVQVRIPQLKQRFVYGINASTNSAALTDAEAFSGTDKARIAFHNDCFLSGPDDAGTYTDYGNTSSPKISNSTVTTALRTYKKQDSKYVAVGGETCDDTYSPQNDCETAGRAETEMAELHYSFLNAHYNTAVNNDWQSGGCMDNIKIKLGYRFVLKNATFPKKAKAGAAMSVIINLDNIGYASPYNARPVQLLLRNKVTGTVKKFDFTSDIRTWFTGAVKLEQTFTLPADIAPGDYDILMNMPDKYVSIANRSEYSIRLGNQNVWEDATGYNTLNNVLTVE
ncbi:MAG: DUF4832 domain-containing protein [Ferruginibacter sp.]